jgi:hypothetical protein
MTKDERKRLFVEALERVIRQDADILEALAT